VLAVNGAFPADDVLFGDQPLIVLGASTGALVTFGLRRPTSSATSPCSPSSRRRTYGLSSTGAAT
jgi:surfactin synthase thioesterase subunit